MFFKSSLSSVGWLIVFLGNPGVKYKNTRHNAGFMAADALAKKNNLKITRLRFKAFTAEYIISGPKGFDPKNDSLKALLMKPQTFMNLSGDSVKQAADFYKIPPERILAVSDDIALPLGKLRIRKSGSAGGHNGLKSVISRLGTENFPRIKIGVGSPPNPSFDVADWVLSAFSSKELAEIQKSAETVGDAIVSIITDGFDAAMASYN